MCGVKRSIRQGFVAERNQECSGAIYRTVASGMNATATKRTGFIYVGTKGGRHGA